MRLSHSRLPQRHTYTRHRSASRMGCSRASKTVAYVGLDPAKTDRPAAMPTYGYARVSTLDQDLTIQRAALKAAGGGVVRAEKASGSRRDGRTELQVLLDFVQPGDTLVVTRIDRLAGSMKDLQDIVHELIEKRVALRTTEQLVDTGTEPSPPMIPMAMTSRSRPAPCPLCSRRVRRTHSWYDTNRPLL